MVCKAVNNLTQQQVVLKLAHPSHIDEVKPSCEYESIFEYTDGIVRIYEYGVISSNPPKMFYTMPKLKNIRIMTPEQELDFVFELLWTIIILCSHGISHDDLHHKNIMCQPVSHNRQYIINDRKYTITYKFTPVIIDLSPDFDVSRNVISPSILRSLFGQEAELRYLIFDPTIVTTIIEAVQKSNRFDILLHPIFDPLRNRSGFEDQVIKTFKPFQINP
jgi:hypothetical protein